MTDYNKLTNKEFDELMCKKYPLLYADRHTTMSETCMCWGFNTGVGWNNLIADASEKLEAAINSFPEDQRRHYRASQVKEKFAQLRLYMTSQTAEMTAIIKEAERLSGITCETCGEPGDTKGTGWIFTMCDKCWELRNKERAGK